MSFILRTLLWRINDDDDEGVVVDHLLFRFPIALSVPELFTIKFWCCLKSRRNSDVFCPPKF